MSACDRVLYAVGVFQCGQSFQGTSARDWVLCIAGAAELPEKILNTRNRYWGMGCCGGAGGAL